MITCSDCIQNKLKSLPCTEVCERHWKEFNEKLRKSQEDIILKAVGHK